MTTAELDTVAQASLLSEPHHDGSELYVSGGEAPGERAAVRLRTPRGAAERVILRTVHDGEAGVAEAAVEDETETETWWRARFPASRNNRSCSPTPSATLAHRWRS